MTQTKILRDVRSADCDPALNVQGSDIVGGPSITAQFAAEEFPMPIPLGDVVATRTGATSVPRVNEGYGDSREPCLVLDEGPELIEAPRVVDATLAATINRCPAPYPLQVFKGDPAAGVLGLRDQALRDNMIHVSSESRFLSSPLPEQTLRGLGVLGL